MYTEPTGLAGNSAMFRSIAEETEICNCGGKGCLDQAASASGIVRYAGKFLRESSQASVLRGKESFTAKDVLEAARNQDRIAEKTVEYCMNFLAKVLAMVSYVVDPEVFIIGGGVSNAGDYLIDMIQKLYEPYITLSRKESEDPSGFSGKRRRDLWSGQAGSPGGRRSRPSQSRCKNRIRRKRA